jgi:hypothetical protein
MAVLPDLEQSKRDKTQCPLLACLPAPVALKNSLDNVDMTLDDACKFIAISLNAICCYGQNSCFVAEGVGPGLGASEGKG